MLTCSLHSRRLVTEWEPAFYPSGRVRRTPTADIRDQRQARALRRAIKMRGCLRWDLGDAIAGFGSKNWTFDDRRSSQLNTSRSAFQCQIRSMGKRQSFQGAHRMIEEEKFLQTNLAGWLAKTTSHKCSLFHSFFFNCIKQLYHQIRLSRSISPNFAAFSLNPRFNNTPVACWSPAVKVNTPVIEQHSQIL